MVPSSHIVGINKDLSKYLKGQLALCLCEWFSFATKFLAKKRISQAWDGEDQQSPFYEIVSVSQENP